MSYPTYLIHYGIPGQKWGTRRWQNEDGSLTPEGYEHYGIKLLKNAKSSNVDSWGKTRDKNILYVTGYSGSGKSTVAKMLKNKNTEVIHLDSYLSKMSKTSANKMQNKAFNSFLDKHVKDWRSVIKEDGKLDYKIVDKMAKASEDWSKQVYKNNKKVVLEGVQLMDTTLYDNRDFYKDKPYMLLNTSAIQSWKRGNKRDEMKGLDMFYRFGYYKATSKTVKEVTNDLNLKKSKEVFDSLVSDHLNKKIR